MPQDSIERTPAGWPFIDPDLYFRAFPAYTLELATKLENSEADVDAAVNAATRAETAAAAAVAAAGRFDGGWLDMPASDGVGQLVIPFKAGRFSASPYVLYSFNTGKNVVGSVLQTIAVSAVQCTVKVTHGNASFTGSVGICWFAVQL